MQTTDQPLMKKPKSRSLKYRWVVDYFADGEIELEDFRKYIRACYKYKKLRRKFEKGEVGSDELVTAFKEFKSIRFIETEKEGKRLLVII